MELVPSCCLICFARAISASPGGTYTETILKKAEGRKRKAEGSRQKAAGQVSGEAAVGAHAAAYPLPPSGSSLLPFALPPPGEVDGQTRQHDEEADAGGLRREVDEVEREQRGQEYEERGHEGVAGRAVRAGRARGLAPHDQNCADHQGVEDEVGGDDVFEQLRVDVAVGDRR